MRNHTRRRYFAEQFDDYETYILMDQKVCWCPHIVLQETMALLNTDYI